MSVITRVIALISCTTSASHRRERTPVEQRPADRLQQLDEPLGAVGPDRLDQCERRDIGPALDLGAERFSHLGERLVLVEQAATDQPLHTGGPGIVGPAAGGDECGTGHLPGGRMEGERRTAEVDRRMEAIARRMEAYLEDEAARQRDAAVVLPAWYRPSAPGANRQSTRGFRRAIAQPNRVDQNQ